MPRVRPRELRHELSKGFNTGQHVKKIRVELALSRRIPTPPPMNWTVETIEEIERHYQVFDSNEIARGLGIKPATLRKAFSKYGVDAPRCRKGRKEEARERLRRCAYKFQACFGWSYADIAEQMELPLWFVASEVVEVVGRAVQMTLWPEERHEVRPRMRAVHVGKRRAVRRCEQLELFTEVTLAIAA